MRIHVVSLSPMSAAQKARIAGLGALVYHDAVLGDPGVLEQVRGAEIAIVTPRLSVDITPALDGCRLLSVQATGVDALNLAACRSLGITVSNVPEFCNDAVAEHAFALLFAVAKRLEHGRPLLRDGRWQSALAYFTSGLRGKTLGLFGCGGIGGRIAEIGAAFGMQVVANVRRPQRERTVRTVDFDTLLAISDFIVLAAPVTTETTGRFDRQAFERMRPSAALVNISRGALIVDQDLVAALDAGRLSGYATDVFRQEPPAPDDPLLDHPKIVVSPHVAWGTADSVERLLDVSIDNVEAFLSGRPIHVVAN